MEKGKKKNKLGGVIGVIEECTLDPQAKKLRVKVRFSKSDGGQEVFKDIIKSRNKVIKKAVDKKKIKKPVALDYYSSDYM